MHLFTCSHLSVFLHLSVFNMAPTTICDWVSVYLCACVCAPVCVAVAPGSLHVVVILGLMKEFLAPRPRLRPPPPPPSLPTTGVRFGA